MLSNSSAQYEKPLKAKIAYGYVLLSTALAIVGSLGFMAYAWILGMFFLPVVGSLILSVLAIGHGFLYYLWFKKYRQGRRWARILHVVMLSFYLISLPFYLVGTSFSLGSIISLVIGATYAGVLYCMVSEDNVAWMDAVKAEQDYSASIT